MIRTVAAVAALLVALPAVGQEPIRFPRTPDISPDGKLLAFSYLGDIWTVEAIGGVARPVTMHESHDYTPVFSPDGRHIAFSSNRHGSYDVFVVPTVGGKPRRLTFDSGQDVVAGWTPDGRGVVFSSTRSAAFPAMPEMYTVPMEGGAEKRLNFFEAKDLTYAPAGDKVAFVRGPGTWYRRGYRGSSNDDVYLANADGTGTKRLTSHDGQDTYPMFAADGKSLFYVTDKGFAKGCANIVKQPLNGLAAAGEATPLTTHTDDTVRRARISGNGEWIVYECGGDIWVTNTKSGGGVGRKVAIEVHADDKSNAEKTTTFTRDATDFALSPDEREAVLVVHGQLFLAKTTGGGRTVRLTQHAFSDHSPAFSPDGKKVLFASDRSGTDDLYLLESDDSENAELSKAHKFKTKRLTTADGEEIGASFIPKTDRIGFIRAGQLWTMKADGTDAKVLIAEKKVMDVEWSPDGKWVAYSRMDGNFASEVYIAPLDGSAKPVNVSRYAIYNTDITWGGSKVAFVSQRRGAYCMHVLSLQRPAADGPKPPEGEIDWDDIHLRVERVSSLPAESGSISADGSTVAFRSNDDLWAVTSDGKTLTRLTTGSIGPRGIRWSKRNPNTIYFLSGTGELRSVRTPLLPTGNLPDLGRVPFTAKITIHRDEEFAEMFAQAWRALADNFYDPAFHGADWPAVRAKYAPLVAHCSAREDLYALVSLMLGELNASHLGISGKLPLPAENTADLGLLFDDAFPGPGLKVAEVLKRGPADKRGMNVKPGDVITQIDRVPLSPMSNLAKMLNTRTGEAVALTLETGPAGMRTARTVEITAVSRDRTAELMYERWTARNAEAVAKQSGGKLGYVHIPSMDEAGLEQFMRSLYSDNFDKEGLVIDVRYNGGGFTHDQVLNYLHGKDHTLFRQRDGGEGFVMRNYDRKFAKPMTVLINNRSYSDAEIFPHAFRASGLGKLVGQATGGLVIGTGPTRLIDGSTFRVPRIGVYTNKSENMDKVGVKPDFAVEITPEDWKAGVDPQLAKAVEVVTAEVVAKRKPAAAGATGARAFPEKLGGD